MKYLGSTSVDMDAVTKKYVDDAASKGNTAYGWGNHASAGYVKSSGVTSITIKNGTGITGGSNTATTTTGTYTIGLTTAIQTDIANGATAYGWGNHASAGYLKTHQDISGKQDKITTSNKLAASLVSGLATVATSGKYSDLSGTPTIPTTLPASDVYAWAKAATKPTYNWSEITNSGAENIVEGTGDFTDNTELLTSYASNNGFADTNAKGLVHRRDAIKMFNYIKGKLPSWSTNATKPSYSWSEIGSRPTALSAFTNDMEYAKYNGASYYHFAGYTQANSQTSFSGYKKILSGTLSAYRINKVVFTMTARHGGCTTYYIQWNQNDTLASYSWDIRAFGAQTDTRHKLKFYYNKTTGAFSVWKQFIDYDTTEIVFHINVGSLTVGDNTEYSAIPSDVGDELACPYNVANSLNSTRTIWGQNFNGSADVSGAMSSVTSIDSLVYFDTTNSCVGMGTSSPSRRLHIVGSSYDSAAIQITRNDTGFAGAGIHIGNNEGGGIIQGNASVLALRNAATDTSAINIDTSQRVGILTSTPSALLDVNGTGVFHKTNVAVPTIVFGSILNITDTSTSIEWALGLKNYNSSNAAGGWGIGIKLGNGGASETNKWAGIAAVAESAWSNLTGLAIYSNAVERIRVRGDGKLFHNTGDATILCYGATNYMNSSTQTYGTETYCLQSCFDGVSGDTTNATYAPSGSNYYRCALSLQPIGGFVGIGTTSPTSKLHVDGNILATGNVAAYSDRRLKSNIQDFEYRGALSPKTYIKDGRQEIGFIAQDVRELYPELVMGNETENDFLSLNYGAITAVLAYQTNDLDKRVKALEEENSKLKKMIVELQK